MHTSQKHLTYFYRHDRPLPGPTSECVFSWGFQILLSKQFICQQDRCCQKHFCTFQEQSRGERNLREFSYCQLQLSLNSVSAIVITYTSLVLGTKGAQIFEQWSPAVDILSANVLRDDCPAHHLPNTQEASRQRPAQVLARFYLRLKSKGFNSARS